MITQFWSFGGGVQSAAIAALIVNRQLPKPDLIAISDKERERSSVWEYLDSVIRPALATVDLEVHRILKSDFTESDCWEDWGNADKPQILVPEFSSIQTSMLKEYQCTEGCFT